MTFIQQRAARMIAMVAIIIASSAAMQAQLPRQISYQGYLAQSGGSPVSDGTYSIVLRLYDAANGGNLLWEETQTTQVAKGLFNLYLGAAVPLDNVDFSKQMYLETALAGQTPFTRTALSQVPYAIYSGHAATASSLDSGFVRSVNGGQGNLVVSGRNGLSVTRDGDSIFIESTITYQNITSINSPQSTIDIINPAGPAASIDVRDGAISTVKIADAAVTAAKLANGAVTGNKIPDGSITVNKLAPGIIPTTLPPNGPAGGDLAGTYPNPQIALNAVSTPKILDAAISTNKLADGAVSTFKIADLAVTTGKVSDNAITTPKLAATGVVPGTYGDELNIPRITVDSKGRISLISVQPLLNFPYIVAAGGDLTGTYPNPQIAPNAVTTSKILDGAVTNAKIPDNAITNTKIVDNSITTYKVVDYTLTINDLAPGTIPNTLPPTGPAGGELAGTYPNPLIGTGVITPSKVAPMSAGNFVIGTGGTPAVGTIIGGTGVSVSYGNPNITISTNTVPGTIDNQTIRWDASTSRWLPNSNVLATAAGAFTTNSNLTVNGNTTIGGSSANTVLINASSVTAPNLPIGSGERFVMSNTTTGALETRTINNVVSGTGTSNRIPRWGSTATALTDGSLDDNGLGSLTRSGSISITSIASDVNIDGAFRVNGRDVYIGDAFGSSLRMREPGGNYDAVIFPDNLGNAQRTFIIPNSNVATTYFVLRDFNGTQNITNGLSVGGAFTASGNVSMPNLPTNSAGTNFVVNTGGALQTRNDVVTAFVGGGISGKTTRWVNASTIGNGSFDDNGAGTLSFPGSFSLNPGAGNSIISNGSLNMNGSGTFGGSVSVGTTLGVTATATFFGNTVLGDASNDVVTINAGTLNATNLPTGSSSSEFLVRSGTAVQTRTINNVTTGTGTAGRMTRWGAGNTLVDASLDDNGNGQYTRDGSIRLASNLSVVNIDDGLVVDGRNVFIGDAFGGSLSIREPGGNYNARITSENLGNATRDYIIPNSSTGTTYFLLRDYNGIQTVNSPLQVSAAVTMLAGTTTYPSTVVPLANRTNTYIAFGEAGSGSDFAYLRQVGGPDEMHLAIDYYDNLNDGRFSIRTVGAADGFPNPISRFTVQNDRVGINKETPGYTLDVRSTSQESLLRLATGAGEYNFFVASNFNNATYGAGAANYGANIANPSLIMNYPGNAAFVFGDNVGPWEDGGYDLGFTFARWRNLYYSGGLYQFSDYRLKTDLRQFDALSIVSKIPVYDYQWKTDGKRMYGFMAHELQAAVPYLVVGEKDAVNDKGEPMYQSVDYTKLTPILTKAIQEQQAKIDEQQARIEKLEALVKELIERK